MGNAEYMGQKRNSQFLFLLSIPLYILQVELEFINKMAMAMKSKKTEMARLCWISVVAMLLLTSTILVTHAGAEAAAAKSNEEVGSGRLPEGSARLHPGATSRATLCPLILMPSVSTSPCPSPSSYPACLISLVSYIVLLNLTRSTCTSLIWSACFYLRLSSPPSK